jgi:hypothetical protein
MRCFKVGKLRVPTGSLFAVAASILGFAAVLSACGGAGDRRFATESYDEYTEPLNNAVIASPTGVTTVGVDAGAGSNGGGSGSAVTVSSSGGGTSGGSSSGGTSGGSSSGGTSGGSGSSGSSSGPSSSSGGGLVGDAGVEDAAGSAEGGSGGGFGFWHFDDCSPTSNFLIDSSGEGANAQHALGAACVPGISGLGVDIRSAKDVITVPDEPQFTINPRIAVAAWVKPTTVAGDQPIVIKRLNNETAFSLGIHNGNIEMSVVLTTGTTYISQAPITAGTWTHVAGMYDGTFVFLFIDGQQFGQVYAGGTIRDVFAPLRIGATTQTQYLHGVVDEVFVSTEVVTAAQIEALACIHQPPTFAVSPEVGVTVPYDADAHYNVSVTDSDVGFCQPAQVDMFFDSFDPNLTEIFDFPAGEFQTVSQGTSVTFGIDVIPNENEPLGVQQLPFDIEVFGGSPNFTFDDLQGQLTLDIAIPSCFVFEKRELMITDVSVVDDPVRTFGQGGGGTGGVVIIPGDAGIVSGSSGGIVVTGSGGTTGMGSGGRGSPPPGAASTVVAAGRRGGGSSSGGGGSSGTSSGSGSGSPDSSVADASETFESGSPVLDASVDAANSPDLGVWTFGHLMREMAPTPDAAPAMALQLFNHWLTNQTVNGFTVVARPLMQQLLLDIWPKAANGDLDLDQAPVTLQAIVNRIDVRNLANGSAGEGRFVFGVNGQSFQNFTIIIEYTLPAKTEADVLTWANLWHGLSSYPFPSEEYNAALEAITERFVRHGANPSGVNGSALAELRTNEIALSGGVEWELRGFVLSSAGFDETTVKETPDLSFNGTATLADFVNENAAAIEAEVPGAMGGTVPLVFEGQDFLGGSVFNGLIEWNAPGITDPNARFHQSLNTCNGCHGPETNTTFLMITPRVPGSEASLSAFITGTQATDLFSGQVRTLNDLGRRQTDLTSLVCPGVAAAPPVDAGAPPPANDAGAASRK